MSKAHRYYAIYRLMPDYGTTGSVSVNSNHLDCAPINFISTGSIGTDRMRLEQVTSHAYKTKKDAVRAMEGLPAIGFYTLLEVYLTIDK